MKTKLLKYTAIMLIAAGVVACVEKGNQESENVPVEFTEYSLAGTGCQWTNLDYDNKVIIINSKKDLEKYITCEEGDFPDVDFSKHTLVFAYGCIPTSHRKLHSMFYQYTAECYKLDVIVYLGEYQAISQWTLSILVPKMSDKVKLDLKVNYVKPY